MPPKNWTKNFRGHIISRLSFLCVLEKCYLCSRKTKLYSYLTGRVSLQAFLTLSRKFHAPYRNGQRAAGKCAPVGKLPPHFGCRLRLRRHRLLSRLSPAGKFSRHITAYCWHRTRLAFHCRSSTKSHFLSKRKRTNF